MKGRIGLLALVVLMSAGCRRREENPPAPADPMPLGHAAVGPRKPSVIQIPDAVKGRWKAARLRVTDTAAGKARDFTADVGQEAPVPGTSLTVKVEALLPHFTMGDGVITSRSEQLANPAAKVTVWEGGQPVFNGWLFSMFPEAHPFEHPKYQLRLLEFVPAERTR